MRLAATLPALILVTILSAPARADLHVMAQDAHKILERAINPGGEVPGPAERTADLKEALVIVQNFPRTRNPRPRFDAIRSLKAALAEIAAGHSDQATDDIRDADSDVRDLE